MGVSPMSMRDLRAFSGTRRADRLASAISSTLLTLLVLLAPGVAPAVQAAESGRLRPPVFANGDGLPAGSGTSRIGAALYADRCAACHGSGGEGGSALELQGDAASLTTPFPDRGIGVYWPNAPALFDYVRRAMPPAKPSSLSADETYAVIAFLLAINGLLSADLVVDADLLGTLKMPNANGFIDRSPPGW